MGDNLQALNSEHRARCVDGVALAAVFLRHSSQKGKGHKKGRRHNLHSVVGDELNGVGGRGKLLEALSTGSIV